MSNSSRSVSSPCPKHRASRLPRLPRPSASGLSTSVAKRRGSEAVSGEKSKVTAAARQLDSATGNCISSSMSLAVAAATFVATGGGRLRRPDPRKHEPLSSLPSLEGDNAFGPRHSSDSAFGPRQSLPRLSLEGPEEMRPPLCLHNVGLNRWIFEQARIIHLDRPSYQARQSDPRREAGMHWVILREVCADVMSATRKCCNAYRLVECLSEAAGKRQDSRSRAWYNIMRLKPKLFAVGVFSKMLGKIRTDDDEAEKMWSQCAAGLSASLSICAKAFASRSRGLSSMRGGNRPCGSISNSLRKYRRSNSYRIPS